MGNWQMGMAVVAGMVCCAATMLWAENAATQPAATEPKAPRIPTKAYYVDDETGEESLQSINAIPPLLNKAGKPTLVREMCYRCTACSPTERRIGYLEKFTPEAQEKLNKMRRKARRTGADLNIDEIAATGFLVRSPAKGSPWVLAESEEGKKVTSNIGCDKGHDPVNLELVLP